MVDNYNVIFKQGVRILYPIPCCGKKPMKDKYKIGDHVNVQSGKKTLRGEINKILKGDKYEVIIDSKIKSYHVSKLKKITKKEEKNTLGIKTKLVSKDVFPLNPNNKGFISDKILEFLNIQYDIKYDNSGLCRIGNNTGSLFEILGYICDKTEEEFKKDFIKDLKNFKNFENLSNIVQKFMNK